MIPVAVLVSGNGTNLQALIDYPFSYGKLAMVVSNRKDAFALERASKAGLEHHFISKPGFEEKLDYLLEANRIEVIVLAGFLKILSPAFTKKHEGRIINIHPSLIPSFCGKGFYGLKVHQAVLERGVTLTGATVHLVNEIPDGGKILMQKAVEVQPEDTPEILQKRVMEEAEWKILPPAVDMLCKELENGH
ncbi:MAG: phosphoribosylglycinamide formyltransferase [Spirochaetia bacterium]|jgi:phosphoribosylglycinamide formyltransferase-1|nr:phosphoribosylglycinamide formyltransferase [Spirochaetia bacterium]